MTSRHRGLLAGVQNVKKSGDSTKNVSASTETKTRNACTTRAILPPKFRFGGKGIRTPDFQLAKLALYQLSYAPAEES